MNTRLILDIVEFCARPTQTLHAQPTIYTPCALGSLVSEPFDHGFTVVNGWFDEQNPCLSREYLK